MEASLPQNYRISDFLEWHEKRQLELNPYFQRRNVWTVPAKVFLIDTILRRMPMPKVFIRTRVDLATQRSYREVVDGQQRLRAIFDFAADRLTLTRRAGEFSGKRYSALEPEHKEIFLSYAIAVDQLINASDSDVLEVFARLNSYTLSLTPPELRQAKYQGNFKTAVHGASQRWDVLWSKFRVVSVRDRLRMQDDSLMAEMFGVLMRGVTDGGQTKINDLYRTSDPTFPEDSPIPEQVGVVLRYIVDHFAEVLTDSPIAGAPHFLMLFAASAHALLGIPAGELNGSYPQRDPLALSDPGQAVDNLALIADVLRAEEPTPGWDGFWRTSKTTTQRIASRRVRFPVYWRALLPAPLA
jgi:hypothetical protein